MIDLERLKSDTNIVDVARDLGLEPKKSGVNFVARCPNHDDKGRPNLTLNAKKKPGAICFSCGFKADAIALVKKVKGCETGEAIHWLADRVGLHDEPSQSKKKSGLGYKGKPTPTTSYPKPAPLPAPAAPPIATVATATLDQDLKPIGDMSTDIPDRFAEELARYKRNPPDRVAVGDQLVMTWVFNKTPKTSLRVTVYEALLSHTIAPPADVVAWLTTKKGLTEATIDAFGLRWLKDWATADREMRKTFGDEVLIGLGLLAFDKDTKKPIGLRFKNHRLLFPFWLTVAAGRWPVYLQARNIHATESNRRFDNPAGDDCPCPYNADALAQARDAGRPIFIVEGLTDTLTIAQSGRFACGIPGANRWKPDWAKSFADLDVYLTRDADAAGDVFVAAVTKSFVDAGLHAPKVVKLPAGQDVTDFFTGQTTKKTTAAPPA